MKIKMIEVDATVEDLKASRTLSQAISDLAARIVDVIGEASDEDLKDSIESDNTQEEADR